VDDSDLKMVGKLCDVLRARGVSKWIDDGKTIEFFPSVDSVPANASQSVDPEMCRCGHPEYHHVNGLCTAGCDAEKCLPPEAK